MDKASTLERVRAQLARDFACAPGDFERPGLVVVEARAREGRRAFPWRARRLWLATTGRGVVASCDAERQGWLSQSIGELSRDEIFGAAGTAALGERLAREGQRLESPVHKLVCHAGSLTKPAPEAARAVTLVEGSEIDAYYALPFSHPLGNAPNPERPTRLITLVRDGERVLGMAGASADCDALWQVGIEVAPAARRRGLATALVYRLTEAILERGRIPYYSTHPSHLGSLRVAQAVGYWHAWLEREARDLPEADAAATQ